MTSKVLPFPARQTHSHNWVNSLEALALQVHSHQLNWTLALVCYRFYGH